MTKIISWNLLRLVGATVNDVASLVRRERPDLLLMQEATKEMDQLPAILGGHYMRCPLPGRIHGLAMWQQQEFNVTPIILKLQSGAMVQRVAQILDLGPFAVANVHLSHGQVLNRRQLNRIAHALPPCAAVLGDYNLVGPTMVSGFRDVGPRRFTHIAADIMPLRLDRCLVRGLRCVRSSVLPREASDHHPIVVSLEVVSTAAAAA
jgi:endonuclease/exonuclease/phosphatase (EEP) superfamily protein YafD